MKKIYVSPETQQFFMDAVNLMGQSLTEDHETKGGAEYGGPDDGIDDPAKGTDDDDADGGDSDWSTWDE